MKIRSKNCYWKLLGLGRGLHPYYSLPLFLVTSQHQRHIIVFVLNHCRDPIKLPVHRIILLSFLWFPRSYVQVFLFFCQKAYTTCKTKQHKVAQHISTYELSIRIQNKQHIQKVEKLCQIITCRVKWPPNAHMYVFYVFFSICFWRSCQSSTGTGRRLHYRATWMVTKSFSACCS